MSNSRGHDRIAPSTMLDVFTSNAARGPAGSAVTFSQYGEDTGSLTHPELDCRARGVAAALQEAVEPGERVLVLCPPGLDYVVSFIACVYAGVIAVPVYPPRPNRSAARLEAVVRDCGARCALLTSDLDEAVAAALPGLRPVIVDRVTASPDAWREPALDGDAVAFLQYTSGSTGEPKGVMVSHANLLHNLAAIQDRFGLSKDSRAVIWLPPYHDMGLIGGILGALHTGYPVTLMSPAEFVQNPLRWLEAISRTRATVSGGPNFAYDWCVERIPQDRLASLDLSQWKVAFNGAEPVRASTMRRFAQRFAPCGFDSDAFLPCYGLAEATLIVTGCQGTPVPLRLSRTALENGEVLPADGTNDRIAEAVDCGPAVAGHRLVIVDPETGTPQPDGRAGEVWFAGPSVAQGYWGRAELSRTTFQAQLPGDEGTDCLRTGDIGFLRDGRLFVTGRSKDLIVVRGRNHHPEDIEHTVRAAVADVLHGQCAAFTSDDAEGQRLVVALEARRSKADAAGVAAAVRQAVWFEHELEVSSVVLVPRGALPKTSSGKIQRNLCSSLHAEARLTVLAEHRLDAVTGTPAVQPPTPADTSRREGRDTAMERLRHTLAGALGLADAEAIDPTQPLSSLGLDSLRAVTTAHRLESEHGVRLPIGRLLDDVSLSDLSELLPVTPAEQPPAEPADVGALSPGQRAMWFLQQVTAHSAANNIAVAVRVTQAVDEKALRTALHALVDRHDMLRSAFESPGGVPVRRVVDEGLDCLTVIDLPDSDEPELERALADLAWRPFDLTAPPLLRVHLLNGSANESVLLLVVHHVITDLWSMSLLAEELTRNYQDVLAGASPSREAPTHSFADFARWHEELLAGPEGDHLRAYWRGRLAGIPQVLQLPTDRPRPRLLDHAGDSRDIVLGTELTGALDRLSRGQGVTLYTTLLTAFQVLLARHTHQDDIVVGSPMAGRGNARWSDVLGYFVNPVALRADLTGNPRFADLLVANGRVVREAIDHQDLPFAELVDLLDVPRDPAFTPVFQTAFFLQQAPEGGGDLGPLAVGRRGSSVHRNGLRLEALSIPGRPAQFDLTLMMADSPDGLIASLHYRTALFNADTAERFLEHLRTLLTELVAEPGARIRDVSLLPTAERELVRVSGTGEYLVADTEPGVHALFARQAARRPEAVALVHEDDSLTYGELDRAARRLADRLRAAGVRPGTPVGLCVERGVDLVVALLGILRSGGCYVPLEAAHPAARREAVLRHGGVEAVVTGTRLARLFTSAAVPLVCVDEEGDPPQQPATDCPTVTPDHLAYVMHTSGSTGTPKGVMVSHGNLLNLFRAMDRAVGCDEHDTVLALTGVGFDISVLELLWPLCRGAKVVVLSQEAVTGRRHVSVPRRKPIDFSLFYFANDVADPSSSPFRLLLEGARFADERGFSAVWTPERHFHSFGGAYANPSVTSAALTGITRRVQLRAGSVVMPLHHSIRVAEEWSIVDNLSGGRVGVAFASGWHPDDFAFFPERYAERHAETWRGIEEVRALWRGEPVTVRGGAGNDIEVRTHPRPVQAELPVWVTAAGSPQTFVKAGELGANLLTHLLGQSVEELAERIALYRQARAEHGHNPAAGTVSLMLHTYVGADIDEVRERVREPFMQYLRSSVGLVARLADSLGIPDLDALSEPEMNALVSVAFDRYFDTSALFGTPETCMAFVDDLGNIGVDELACLIDFGVDDDVVLTGLQGLETLRHQTAAAATAPAVRSAAEQIARHGVTLTQCTPSAMRLLLADEEFAAALAGVRTVLLGGEALPAALAERLLGATSDLRNMYGPTETTVWSTTERVRGPADPPPIGRPIGNTRTHIVDARLRPVPVNVPGELCIGGEGVAVGYLGDPAATAVRFVADPFADAPGARMYRTGDLARWRADGTIEFLGRTDDQVKIRGHRVELSEIDTALCRHPAVREAAVTARREADGDTELVAYIGLTRTNGEPPTAADLQRLLRESLPEHMVPGRFVALDAFPLTTNDKLDRNALHDRLGTRLGTEHEVVAPLTDTERVIAGIWQEVLGTDTVGVDDNFFAIGGNSLRMVQVHNRLQETFGCRPSLITLFEYPTVKTLSRHLADGTAAQPTSTSGRARAQRQREAQRGQRRRRQKGAERDGR